MGPTYCIVSFYMVVWVSCRSAKRLASSSEPGAWAGRVSKNPLCAMIFLVTVQYVCRGCTMCSLTHLTSKTNVCQHIISEEVFRPPLPYIIHVK